MDLLRAFFLVECIGNEPTAVPVHVRFPIDRGGGDVPMSTTNCCCQPSRRLSLLFNLNKNPVVRRVPLDPSSNTADLFSITQLKEMYNSLKGDIHIFNVFYEFLKEFCDCS